MKLLAAVAFSACLSGCGAFADIAGEEGKPALLDINPPVIYQNQYNNFTITFIPPPPWSGQDAGFSYVVDTNFGPGINYQNLNYQGAEKIQTGLFAQPDAPVGLREFAVTLGFQQAGQPQKLYAGRGNLYVYRRTSPDGGSGGSDGDGGEE